MKGFKRKKHECDRTSLIPVAGSERLYVRLWECPTCGEYFDERGVSVDTPSNLPTDWQLIAQGI